MAGFARSNTEKTSKKKGNSEINDLEEQLNKVTAEIRVLLGDNQDKNKLDLELKRKLGTKYVKGAELSREPSQRVIDEAEQEKYSEYCKKFSKKAEEYGSSIVFEVPKTSLDDVKGLENVKSLVRSFIFMAKNPKILEAYNIEGGFGLFMYGAPGTGKTMFAKAIAHELNLPMFVVEPSNIFKSYVGESEASVKQLFEQINLCKNGAVVFIDECDELFSKRSSGTKDYKSAVTNQLLQNLNGFNTDGSKRILIAATNLPENIDSAYLRYKRFSHHVHITPPDSTAIRAILVSKLTNIPLENSVEEVANSVLEMLENQCMPQVSLSGDVQIKGRAFYSSADICGIVEDACRVAVEKVLNNGGEDSLINGNNFPPVTMDMFENAINNKKPSISAELLSKYTNFAVNKN